MTREVPLSKGFVALIDDEDFDLVTQYRWHYKRGYATATPTHRGPTIFMHRLISGARADVEVDHRNLNGLDNQRSNLRHATAAQQSMNRSKFRNCVSLFKGVVWEKSRQKWRAKITFNRKCLHLGRFDNEEDAARAYDMAAIRLFGEFAFTNFGGPPAP